MGAHLHDRRFRPGAADRTRAVAAPDGSLSRGVAFASALSLPIWLALFYLAF